MKKQLSKKEKVFCRCYINSGNIKDSAIMAGYVKMPQIKGEELLSRSEILKEIEALSRTYKKYRSVLAEVSYRKLALGSISNAVSLLFLENPTAKQLSKMDLFSVSEIKKAKDGSIEIKFFNRLNAIEKLESLSSSEESPFSLYEALAKGAKSIDSDERAENVCA